MRYRIDMCYDGTPFCGWQVQPSDPSVQGEVEKALATLLKAPVGVVGAGRTDTGVSASHYVAHFDFDSPVPPALAVASTPAQSIPSAADVSEAQSAPASTASGVTSAGDSPSPTVAQLDCKQLKYKLNAILPSAIAVQGIQPVADDFHARFSAVSRQYQYFLHRVKDPFLDSRSYYFGYPEVDFEAMNRAAQLLLGTHDFSCFEKSGGDNKTSICSVTRAVWEPYIPELLLASELSDPEAVMKIGGRLASTADGDTGQRFWRFTIEADRFLRNMVRAIVGTLLEVGRGRRTLEEFASLILDPLPGPRRCLRSNAGESVPGHALFLTDIRY